MSFTETAVAEQWRYRLLGEEFGPVPTFTLRELLASGDLSPADEVAEIDGDWRRADAVLELTGMDAGDSPEIDDDLASLLEQAGTAEAAPAAAPRVEEGWYARILGAELGPLEWDRLSFMTAQGELSPQDQVRRGSAGPWQRAGEIVGLFDAIGSLDATDSVVADKPCWFCERAAGGSTAATWPELQALAASGQLSPRDRIREGELGPWVRAATLPGLFTEQERTRTWAGQAEQTVAVAAHAAVPQLQAAAPPAIEAQAAPASPPGSTAPAPIPEPPAAAPPEPPDRWAQFFDAAEAREQKRRQRNERHTPAPPPNKTSPAIAEVHRSAPSAALAAPTVHHAPSPPPPTQPQPAPAFVAPPKRKAVRQGPAFNLSGLLEKLKGAGGTKLLIPLLLGAIVIGWKFMPALGGQPGAEDLPVLEGLWQKALQMQSKNGTAADWSALEAEAKPVLDEMQARLAPIVDSRGKDVPVAQRILWMVDIDSGPTGAPGYFRKILSGAGNASQNDFSNASGVMSEASGYLPRP